MKNVEDIIIIFFERISSDAILSGSLFYHDVSASEFEKVTSSYLPQYSANERAALYEHLLEQYGEMQRGLHGWIDMELEVKWNVFHALFLFAKSVLLEEKSQIMCHYEELLNWRRVTREVGEELLVTAFCAVRDISSGNRNRNFNWKQVIGNNNVYLNKILSQGLADNHFHLWASAPIFQLSWVRLMNDVDNPELASHFSSIDEEKRRRSIRNNYSDNEKPLAVQYRQAVLIRLFLYSWLTGSEIELREYFLDKNRILEYLDEDIWELFGLWEIKEGENIWDIKQSFWKFVDEYRIPVKIQKRILDFLQRFPVDKMKEKDINSSGNFRKFLEKLLGGMDVIPLKWFYPILRENDRKKLWIKCTEKIVEQFLADPEMLADNMHIIQDVIEGLRSIESFSGTVWDYMLTQITEGCRRGDDIWYLNGERWFLYQMFCRILKKEDNKKYFNWFYAYLVIQGAVRGELIQVNSEIGFYNFSIYERRKDIFTMKKDWRPSVIRMAMASTLSNPNIRMLEARIAPRNTVEENLKYITELDRCIDPEGKMRDQYYYVMHFIKQEDKGREDNHFECRSYELRKKIKKQAKALALFRENYPKTAARVRGIDAAAQEIGCRPEVFAQAFRFLRKHTVDMELEEEKRLRFQMLGVTYHVGEDFMDLADGLRAIHEAIRFLNMDCGDRLGHALALGVDVEQWYNMKNRRILISQQDYLDNLAWIHGRIVRFHIMDQGILLHYIEGEFDRYFKKVYAQFMGPGNDDLNQINPDYVKSPTGFNIETYYSAWKLRSDNPYCYFYGSFKPPVQTEREYDYYNVNEKCPRARNLRKLPEVAYLYYTYHFNRKVKEEGEKRIEIKIPDIWIEGVKRVQKQMQQMVAECGIGIETNPTSNYIIGTFRDYAKHPITQWYNAHLTSDQKKLQECAQILVSINTDDQGVFSTSLENEYALLACALEKEQDEEGRHLYPRNMIYEWLEEIRKMGLRQSFDLNFIAPCMDSSGEQSKIW